MIEHVHLDLLTLNCEYFFKNQPFEARRCGSRSWLHCLMNWKGRKALHRWRQIRCSWKTWTSVFSFQVEREHLEIELQELTKEKPEDPRSAAWWHGWHGWVFFGVHRIVSWFVGMSIQGFRNWCFDVSHEFCETLWFLEAEDWPHIGSIGLCRRKPLLSSLAWKNQRLPTVRKLLPVTRHQRQVVKRKKSMRKKRRVSKLGTWWNNFKKCRISHGEFRFIQMLFEVVAATPVTPTPAEPERFGDFTRKFGFELGFGLQLERTGEVAEPAEAEPSPAEPPADGDLGDPVVEDLTFLASIVFAFGIACWKVL